MDNRDILSLIEDLKRINIEEIASTNSEIESNLKTILGFLKDLTDKYIHLVEELINAQFRFCDYYGFNKITGEGIIEYFENNYNGEDKEKYTELFALYVLLKNAVDIVVSLELCESYDELYTFLDNNSYFEDMLSMVEYIKDKEMILDEDESDLGFLNPNNKYKILFSGTSYKDIKKLQKTFKKAFIKKISGQLSNSDVITLAECVDHVKELYGFPIFRVQFGNDYRIAYLRKDNVTVILGVTMKSGKDIDYTRYDSVAKNEREIYEEVRMLLEGTLPEDSQHYKTIHHLQEFIQKIKEQ